MAVWLAWLKDHMKFELGPGMKCDLAVLMESRLLIQAQSGGGKSRTLRRILEQTHGKVQQIVIDPEGEFSTLREKFDYVLAAGSGGDALAHPKTAAMLAERLLELQVSAVIDLYELKPLQRVAFVKVFLEALIEAPKRLRHPCVVAIDEAQMFAPEGGKAESAAAVADLAVRGRKRGLCLIAAVARLSEFDKATAAPLLNKLIGLTSLDLDMKRAAQDLGFDKAGMLGLRNLEGMQFWGFGPALVRAPTLVTIGEHVTTHLRPGARLTAVVPPPTDKIKALLPQLADLPAEAEQKQRSEAELKKDLAAARATITRLERAAPLRVETKVETQIERVMVPMLTEQHVKDLKDAATALQLAFGGVRGTVEHLESIRGELPAALHRIDVAIAQATKPQGRPVQTSAVRPVEKRAASILPPRRNVTAAAPADGDQVPLTTAQQAVLNAAAFLESLGIGQPDVVQLALFAGQSATGGYWRANIGRLRVAGLIAGTQLTDQGRALAQPSEISNVEQLHAHVLTNLLEGKQRQVLQVLLDCYPDALTAEEVGERADVTPTGGYWRTIIGRLRSLGLVTRKGPIAALPVLFLEGAA